MSSPSASSPPAQNASPRRRRRVLFAIAAIVCGLLPLLTLEIALRVSGEGDDEQYLDPLVGFSRVAPLFELDEETGTYRTARSRQVLFETQEFPAVKPANGFRIFCLGGSTVRGRPYTTATAFPRWLQIELAERDADHQYEVINCGGLSYASYRLTAILQEVLSYDPDLIVIATGHNEFLEDRTYAAIKHRSSIRAWFEDRLHRLRTIRLLRRWAAADVPGSPSSKSDRTVLPELVEARLDEASGYASYHRDDEWAASVLLHFRQSLQAMVELCEDADVPACLVLLGSNVRDCPPFKSEHRPNLDLNDEREWRSLFDQADEVRETQPEEALRLYQQAESIDDEHALLRFRLARQLDRLGRVDEAADHYFAAKDFDVCPLRMREQFAATVREVAAQTGTLLIDGRGKLEERADDRIPGNDWYMDHVHPSIGGHQILAAAIAAELSENAATASGLELDAWSGRDRRAAYRRQIESLGPNYLIDGYERVSWLENWARRRRLAGDTLPQSPAEFIRFGHREWDFGHQSNAWQYYKSAVEMNDDVAPLLLRIERLVDEGRGPEAESLLDRLTESSFAPEASILTELRRQLAD